MAEHVKKNASPAKERDRRYPIVSTKLPTGQLVETLHRPNVPETVFAVGSHGETLELGKVPAPGGGWYVPYSPRNNLLTHRVVLLPSAVDEYQAEPILLALVRGFIRRYVDLSLDFEEVASHYVLFTWVYDDFAELPYLRVQGDYGSGKSRFLQTVGSIAYKPIFASGASSVSPIFRILDAVAGTLVIDEGDFRFSDEKADIIKILNNGNAAGFPVLRSDVTPTGEYSPRAFRVFGPKLIATRGAFDDRALESRCITEVMGRRHLRRDVPLNLPDSFEAEALSLRNKLLLYRFRHAGESFDLDAFAHRDLEPRVAQVFAPLLACADGGAESLARIAKRHGAQMRGHRGSTIEADILAAAAELRRQVRGALALKTLAGELLRVLGEPITPREVGTILRRLGVAPTKRQGVSVIPVSEFPLLDLLAERYGVEEVAKVDKVDEAGEVAGEETRRNKDDS